MYLRVLVLVCFPPRAQQRLLDLAGGHNRLNSYFIQYNPALGRIQQSCSERLLASVVLHSLFLSYWFPSFTECKSCGIVLSDGDRIPLIISKTVTKLKGLILHSYGMVKPMPCSLLSPNDLHLTQ